MEANEQPQSENELEDIQNPPDEGPKNDFQIEVGFQSFAQVRVMFWA